VEEGRQQRSSWYFVPERYPIDRAVLEQLRQRGHEIGVHGLSHTGKLFSSRTEFTARLPRIND
jgi:predicted deacetylase